jgi:undecaprenyl-diphosphatase
MAESLISTSHAFILGVVEGLTEYLPISSTGHLIITSQLLGLRSSEGLTPSQIEAIQAFEIVIQGGAILAVTVLYHRYLLDTVLGVLGKSIKGRQLFINICCATLPVLVAGFLLKDWIARYLQFPGPVLLSLVLGGVVMLVFEKFQKQKGVPDKDVSIHDLTWKGALAIGMIQCFALWPGMSRSMVTIVGGMSIGLRRGAAAEFSFLVGLPVLLAATLYKGLKDGDVLLEHIGSSSLCIGVLTSAIAAALAIRWLVSFLNRRGLALFGWYRLVLAAAVYFLVYA